jgi:hypothetical protein
MFGHDDQSQHHQDADNATPDGGASVNNGPIINAPQTQVDDTAGDYIESNLPATPATAPQTDEAPVGAVPAPAAPVGGHANADQLLDIKQQALQQLTPLIGHLEQNPEEKFRTTMMMIQAADNDALIKDAYDAALQIQDEKVRAQALLDIVNEINYFTHNAASPEV